MKTSPDMDLSPTIGIAMDFVIPGVIEGAGAYAREHGLRVDARWSVRADWIPGNPGWAGIIASLTEAGVALQKIQEMELPIVHVCGWMGDEALPRVDDNFFLCAKLAVKEFRKLGISRIAGMKSSDYPSARCSFRTLRTECRKEGLKLFPLQSSQQGPSWLEGIPDMAQQIAALEHPVGLFHPQASVIFSLLDELARLSVRVPEDVAIIVIEKGVQQTAKLAPVPLTGVILDEWQKGYEAARLVHRMIQGEAVAKTIQRIPPMGLVRRQSTGGTEGKDPAVAKALHLIAEGEPAGIEIHRLARLVGVSRRSLELRFKKETGSTLHRAIISKRIADARHLLGTGKLPVFEVAEECAFSSVHYFSAAFKRETGETPGTYRKRVSQ
jgi:AraC-like DNA-binding protein